MAGARPRRRDSSHIGWHGGLMVGTNQNWANGRDAPLPAKDARSEAPGAYQVARFLEPELRAKCDPQVVVRSTVEVDVIANFGANADGTGKGFDSAAGVDS